MSGWRSCGENLTTRAASAALGPSGGSQRREGGRLAGVAHERIDRDRLTRLVGDEPDPLQLEMRAEQQVVRVRHPGAVLEAEMRVLRLGGDEGEVARPAS